MSFTSLLPPPKYSKKGQEAQESQVQRNRELALKALTDDADEGNGEHQEVSFDSLIASKLSFQDFVPIRQRNFNLQIPKPSDEEIEKTYNRTKEIFDKIILKTIQPEAATVKSSRQANDNAYKIEYNRTHSSGNLKPRVLKIVERAQDPLQPNTIKAGKVVAPPVEEPDTPIFHKTDASETDKKLSKEERDKWNIPAAISSWKNPNGYTIALEKRMAMDARYNKDQMKPHDVSDGFAKLSRALEAADRKAREEIKLRAEAKRQLAEEETKEREEKLRLLAQKAREERGHQRRVKSRYDVKSIGDQHTAEFAANQRELVRKSRREEIERDIRRSKMSTADRLRELAYSQGRDISEKVVLGAAKATESSETHYDSRLFSKGANAQAKRNEDQVYDRPLFVQQDRDTSYRANLQKIDSMIRDEDSPENMSKDNRFAESELSKGPIRFTKSDEASDADKGKEYGLQNEN